MIRRQAAAVGSALAWVACPLVPAVLEDFLQTACAGPDPREWEWITWAIMLGPLLGFGFLAGATARIPDEPDRRGIRWLLSRRTVWVGVGPWAGCLAWAAIAVIHSELVSPHLDWNELWQSWNRLGERWPCFCWAVDRLVLFLMIATFSYAWLPLAWSAIRRAGRAGRRREAIERGLATAVGFVGSLFGSFWAITETWRSFFFDPRVFPVLVAAAGLTVMSGCGNPTYGEMRRRELFHAMMLSWVIGLALTWRWWGRPRPKPPRE